MSLRRQKGRQMFFFVLCNHKPAPDKPIDKIRMKCSGTSVFHSGNKKAAWGVMGGIMGTFYIPYVNKKNKYIKSDR